MTTLKTAADILRCFNSDCRSVAVTDVATKLGLHKSRVSRTLKSMLAVGLLERSSTNGAYSPSPLLSVVGRVYLDSYELLKEADAVVREIAERTGHTGYVSKLDGTKVFGVTDHPGTNVLRVMTSIGRKLDASATATGRALLAMMPDHDVLALYPDGLTPPSPSSPQSVPELLARLSEVRRTGFAESNDEANRGVGALAVTIGETVDEALSLCITFPAATVTYSEKQEIEVALLEGAQTLRSRQTQPALRAIAT